MEFLSDDLHDYIAGCTTQAPAYLDELERETWVKMMMPRMLSGHVQGQILKMFSSMMRPTYILEVGTYTGYASHFLVEGLKLGGEFHAVEINEELETIIKKYWSKHEKSDQMHLHVGPAAEVLESLHRPWDLIFLDADKINLIHYYEQLLPQLRIGGIMLIDNILWSGKVVGGAHFKDKDTKAIQALNDHVSKDNRVEQVILSVRDGIMMVRKV